MVNKVEALGDDQPIPGPETILKLPQSVTTEVSGSICCLLVDKEFLIKTARIQEVLSGT